MDKLIKGGMYADNGDMLITGAIFDMDGTLLDSMGAWYTAGSRYIRSLGMTPPPTMDEDILRLSLAEAAVYMRDLGVNKPLDEIQAGFNAVMDDFYFNEVEARPGVHEFLETLKKKGVPMCVSTASDRYQVEAALKRTGLFGYFGSIFTCTELNTGKHESKIFDAAREFMGTNTDTTWVFEDARHAAGTAKKAGYKVCGICDASEPDQKELEEIADVYVVSVEELNI